MRLATVPSLIPNSWAISEYLSPLALQHRGVYAVRGTLEKERNGEKLSSIDWESGSKNLSSQPTTIGRRG